MTPLIFRERPHYVITTGGTSLVRELNADGSLSADEMIDILTGVWRDE